MAHSSWIHASRAMSRLVPENVLQDAVAKMIITTKWVLVTKTVRKHGGMTSLFFERPYQGAGRFVTALGRDELACLRTSETCSHSADLGQLEGGAIPSQLAWSD